MGKDEQERLRQRMTAWAGLTPEQRKVAREKFRNVQQATPEQREALKKLWTEYQALPENEKARIQHEATGTGNGAPKSPATTRSTR